MTVAFASPILSTDPVDWTVYADWLEEHPDKAKILPEKAKRIAFVLEHWKTVPQQETAASQTTMFVDGNGRVVETLPRARTESKKIGPRQLWLVKRRTRRHTNEWTWNWSLWPTPLLGTWPDEDDASWRHADQATSPADSKLCHGNIRYAVRFFNTILHQQNLQLLLDSQNLLEYRRKFDKIDELTTLDKLIRKGCRSVRRFPWRKDGTRLDLENVIIEGGTIVADAVYVCPEISRLLPPRRFTLTMTPASRGGSMLRGSCHETIFKARPMTRDWIPA